MWSRGVAAPAARSSTVPPSYDVFPASPEGCGPAGRAHSSPSARGWAAEQVASRELGEAERDQWHGGAAAWVFVLTRRCRCR